MDETYPTQGTDTPEVDEQDAVEAGRNFIQRRQDDVTARLEQFLQLPGGWKAVDIAMKGLWLTMWSGGITYAAEHLPGDIGNLDPTHISKDVAFAALSGGLMWWRAHMPKAEKQELLDDRQKRQSTPNNQTPASETQ